jgi:hypothetical protein
MYNFIVMAAPTVAPTERFCRLFLNPTPFRFSSSVLEECCLSVDLDEEALFLLQEILGACRALIELALLAGWSCLVDDDAR